jgi:repressor LexA
MSLTFKQKQVLEFIQQYRRENGGVAPSLHEIRRAMDLKAVSTVHGHVRRLIDGGYLQHQPHDKRGLEVVHAAVEGLVAVPWTGVIAAGRPVEALSNEEALLVPSFLLRSGKHFVLKVRGDSMIDDGIHDGDWIILQKRDAAADGETAAVLLNGEVTLKKFYREGGTIRLQPANPAMEPLRVPETDVRVQGVVVGLMRKY